MNIFNVCREIVLSAPDWAVYAVWFGLPAAVFLCCVFARGQFAFRVFAEVFCPLVFVLGCCAFGGGSGGLSFVLSGVECLFLYRMLSLRAPRRRAEATVRAEPAPVPPPALPQKVCCYQDPPAPSAERFVRGEGMREPFGGRNGGMERTPADVGAPQEQNMGTDGNAAEPSGAPFRDLPPVPDLQDANLCLDHAFDVIGRLKLSALSGTDRLEVDNIEMTLRLYRAKRMLTREEMRSCNDCLALLLKLMAKYEL